MRPTVPVIVLLALVLLGLPGVSVSGQPTSVTTDFSDTVDVVKDEVISNAEVAVRLVEATPSLTGAPRIAVARDDVFADSMSSGPLQGDSPLLLVPTSGTLPTRTADAIRELGAGQAVLLGGTAAISPGVEAQLAGLGLQTTRLAGPDRVATAVEIARSEAPTAQTVILSRAFGSATGDPTQAFADSLAVGGWAAATGWPVLLTDSTTLSTATADYLATSAVQNVEIVGGTAAISDEVAEAVAAMGLAISRTAGPNRFATAVAIAGKRGAESAADVSRVVVAEGQDEDAWAGGFAAAAHSAAFDAPIVLTNGADIPPETAAFLGSGIGRQAAGLRQGGAAALTCVTRGSAVCHEARRLLGLPEAAIDISPGGGPVVAGTTVQVTVSGDGPLLVMASGSCLDGPLPLTAGGGQVVLARDHPCDLTVQVTFPDGTVQRSTASYDDDVPLPPAATPTPTVPPVGPGPGPGPGPDPTDEPTVPSTGAVDGQVVSAVDGSPLAGADVVVGTASTTTGSDGSFGLTLAPGTHTATASADGYIPDQQDVTVVAGQTTDLRFSLSPELTSEDLRIVLTWGEEPRDLDSHLWLPESAAYHVVYFRPGTLEFCPFAELDVDDTSSFGPETITVGQAFDGVYRYAVHNFTGTPSRLVSEAVVRVFDATGEVASFEVPDGSDSALWWHVFDIEVSTGELLPGEGLLEESPEPYTDTDAGCTIDDV